MNTSFSNHERKEALEYALQYIQGRDGDAEMVVVCATLFENYLRYGSSEASPPVLPSIIASPPRPDPDTRASLPGDELLEPAGGGRYPAKPRRRKGK